MFAAAQKNFCTPMHLKNLSNCMLKKHVLQCTKMNLSNSMLKKHVLQCTNKNLSNSMLRKHVLQCTKKNFGKVTVDYFQCLLAIITERYKKNGNATT